MWNSNSSISLGLLSVHLVNAWMQVVTVLSRDQIDIWAAGSTGGQKADVTV